MFKYQVPKRQFCVRPFRDFYIGNKGDVYCCCGGGYGKTPIGNLLVSSVEEIWNGKKIQGIRRDMLYGTAENDYCKNCPAVVSKTLSNKIPKWLEGVRPELQSLPVEVNCGYDRTCNLSCPSCRSCKFVATSSDLNETEIIHKKVEKDLLPHAKVVYCSGAGDPFVSPFFRNWFRTLKPEDMPNLERFSIMTNGEMLTPEMWESMSQMHSLVKSVAVSMDAATPETFSVLRRGGHWDRLQKNLRFLATLPVTVALVFVVQRKNYKEMQEFVEMTKSFNPKWVAKFNVLVNFGTFTDEEFLQEAVHLPGHPEHDDYLFCKWM